MTQQVSKPDITATIVGASNEVANAAQKILVIGQKVAGGSTTSGTLYQNITETNIASYFGRNSMIANQLRALKDENSKSQVDAIPLDDNAAGVAATGSVAFSGTATENGTLSIIIGSETDNKYDLSVTSGDTANDIGAALETAVNADADAPFTASNSSGTVTITCDNDGTEGNQIGLRAKTTIAGIATTLVKLNGGSGNPSLTGLFDVIDGIRYQTIVFPATYGLTELKTELTSRWDADNKILDGMAIVCKTDTLALLKSTYTSENNQQLAILGNALIDNADHRGPVVMEIDYKVSARIAGIRALRLTANEAISSITVAGTNGARDSFGGDAIRSLPYHNTPLTNFPLAPSGLGFTSTEIDELETAGVSVFGNNVANNAVIMGAFVTSYKTDAAGNTDVSFKYVNYVDTMSGIREYQFNNLKSQYAQTRLTDGTLQAGRNMANSDSIESYLIKLYGDLSGSDYVLCQAGETALNYYKNNLSVTTTLATGLVTVAQLVPIVTQLRSIVLPVQMSFTTT